MSPLRTTLATVTLAALPLGVAACPSPAQDDDIDALGPELDDVEPGEFHRPGQPCLRCHGGYGPGHPVFSIGGTVFATPTDKIPVAGVEVQITDARGETRTAVTNCVGNFYIEESEWQPAFPLAAQITCAAPGGATDQQVMASRINRDGSCAGCHENTPALDSVGWIYCSEQQPTTYVASPGCPGRVP